jgi:excisionase family DNA binding protein
MEHLSKEEQRHRLENAHGSVEAAAVEARHRVRLNEERERARVSAMTVENREWLTPKEFARRCGFAPTYGYVMARKGRVEGISYRDTIRVPADAEVYPSGTCEMQDVPHDGWLLVEEVASRLGVTRSRVEQLIWEGRLPYRRTFGFIEVPEDAEIAPPNRKYLGALKGAIPKAAG